MSISIQMFYSTIMTTNIATPTVVNHMNVHNSILLTLIDPWLLSSELTVGCGNAGWVKSIHSR